MGSGISKKKIFNENGSIIIHTDKTTYIPGDLVSGKIYFHAFSSHPPCQLELEFQGIELCCLVTHGKHGRRLEQRDRKFKNTSWQLHQWESELSAGHIEIPFSFTLPHDLPPSFHQEGLSFLAHISYILEVWLKPLHKAIKFKPLSEYEKLVIRIPINRPPKSYSEEKRFPIASWGLIPQGSVTIVAHMDKDIYSEQEVARVFLEIDNTQGKLDISSVQVQLLQILKLDNLWAYGTYRMPICTETMARIPAKTKSEPQVLQLNIPRFRGDTHDMEARTSHWPQGETDKGDGILGLTTKSRFTSSEFCLEVVCSIDGIMTSTPKISRIIDITYPDPQPQVLNLPANWNPQILTVIPLQVNSSAKKSQKQKRSLVVEK